MSAAGLLPVLFGVLGLFAAYRVYAMVLAYPAGEGKVAKIAEMIHMGAMVFMKREHLTEKVNDFFRCMKGTGQAPGGRPRDESTPYQNTVPFSLYTLTPLAVPIHRFPL